MNLFSVLGEAIRKYAAGYEESFGVNIHDYVSLPSLAQSIAFKFYGDNCAPIYSFGQEFGWINEEIRDHLIGGLVMVFKEKVLIVSDFFIRIILFYFCQPL